MKTLKYLFFILCLPLFAGCFEDETTVDTVRISEISIDTLKNAESLQHRPKRGIAYSY